MAFISIYITHSSETEAKKVTNHLLEKKMVACGNIFPMQSAYWWKGEIQNDDEYVSIVKTTTAMWDRVKEEVEKIHPYDVPCIMKIEVEANEAYENWIHESVETD